MKDMDVKMTALIEDTSKWILPDLAPNGTYSASPVCEGGSGHGGSRLRGPRPGGSGHRGLGLEGPRLGGPRNGESRYQGNGEEVCEGHGFSPAECVAISCCEWDDGDCWSAVGQDQCLV